MYRFTIAVCLTMLISLVGVSLADIPKLINYQGMLTNDSGQPLTGMYDITFKIYNASSGGDKRWEETQTDVAVTDGLFNVILGGATVGGIDLDFSEEHWLDITVGAEHVPDRLRFTSVAYAYRAQWSDTAEYALTTIPGSGSHWSVSDSVLYTSKLWGVARGAAGNVLYGDSVHTYVNFGVRCTTGASGQNHKYCTVGGGRGNAASGAEATVGGGGLNAASGDHATVGGGWWNTSGYCATAGGGAFNTASGANATVGGGYSNVASGYSAAVGGGYDNTASGFIATVAGGFSNAAGGDYSFAAGRRAKANHLGTFVWADSSVNADFTSTGENQFLIRAAGGVGIGTNSPDEELHVDNSVGDNRVKVSCANACTSSIKLFESNDYGFEFAYAGNDDKFHLWSKKFSGNEGIRMTWLKDGRVGIGTTDPARDLHIAGNGYTEIELEKTDAVTNKWHISLYSDGLHFTETDLGTRMTLEDGGNVGIGTTDPAQKLDVNGIARIRSWGTTHTHDVQVNADGDLCKVSSSKRYKKNIRELESHPDRILDLKPVRFEWKTTSESDVGLIAEDVHQLIPELVGYDKEGRPDAVRYELVSLYLLELVRGQVAAIRELKEENEELRHRIEALEHR